MAVLHTFVSLFAQCVLYRQTQQETYRYANKSKVRRPQLSEHYSHQYNTMHRNAHYIILDSRGGSLARKHATVASTPTKMSDHCSRVSYPSHCRRLVASARARFNPSNAMVLNKLWVEKISKSISTRRV